MALWDPSAIVAPHPPSRIDLVDGRRGDTLHMIRTASESTQDGRATSVVLSFVSDGIFEWTAEVREQGLLRRERTAPPLGRMS